MEHKFSEEEKQNIKNNKLLFILLRIELLLTPPAKIMFALWSVASISCMSSNDITFFQKIAVILFGYFFYCGISNLIYRSKKGRYVEYKLRVWEKYKRKIYCESYKTNIFNKLYKNENITNENNKIILQEENIKEEPVINYDKMNGHEFENFCADILKNNCFYNVEVTQGSGDHGIDILAEKDTIEYAIQCKCYSSNIGNSAVQQAFSGKNIYRKDIAVVLTNQYFTQQAKEEAKKLGVKLWDRDKLNKLIENSTK